MGGRAIVRHVCVNHSVEISCLISLGHNAEESTSGIERQYLCITSHNGLSYFAMRELELGQHDTYLGVKNKLEQFSSFLSKYHLPTLLARCRSRMFRDFSFFSTSTSLPVLT